MATAEETLKKDIAFRDDFVRSATGDLDTISGLANLKAALFRRLITSPGSLIHRPNYGVGIKDYQNSMSDLPNQQNLALRIKEQFELDPRVEKVVGVRINYTDAEPEKVVIVVRVKVVGYDELTASFKPFGSEGVI